MAFYLDEAPVPVPVIDPKLFDVERIEVLRGREHQYWNGGVEEGRRAAEQVSGLGLA